MTDDMISRQKAIKWVKTECNPYGNPTLNFESGMKVIDHLKQMPAIDPVEHGRWISVPHKKDRICSVCGDDEPYKFADEDANVFDYCPHCGAKMDGNEE